MTVLLDEQVPRTLEELVPQLEKTAPRGAQVEAWVFDGAPARREAEARLAAAGVRARLHSAYKPLLHFFLEDVVTDGLRRATIRYPVCPAAADRRFLMEAYPLAALLPGVETRFRPGDATLAYRVALEYRDRQAVEHEVFAPNRLRADHLGERRLSPTGWLRVTHAGGGARDVDQRLGTDFEVLFQLILDAVQRHPWDEQEPQFEQLVLRAEIPGADQRLPYFEECVSIAEALHEDLYFSVLEMFKHRAGRAADDRTTRPGQIVPDIRYTAGQPRARVALEPFVPADADASTVPLETAARALSLEQIRGGLASLGGEPITAESRQGRQVEGIYRRGTRAAIVVTAGQHANETSGIVGALRAAHRLAARSDTHFAVIPLENPDGYVLHRRLCAVHPHHMHHAARYTAFGDDLQYRTRAPWHETAARLDAFRRSAATLHINLHGYPAHEWTRPLTGYLPRGFDAFAIPKGFYLGLLHHRAWSDRAAAFRTQLTERLGRLPELVAFNRAQLASYRAHAGEPAFPVDSDVPCKTVEDDRIATPLMLITEFPDETIAGDPFVLAHTVQMHTVLAAEEIHASLELPQG